MSQGVNTSEIAQMEAPAESVNPEHGLPESFGEGLTGRLLFWIAVSFSTFQIITSFGIPLDQPFIAGLSLTHLWGVAMVAWAAWLIGLAVRRRSIVDGAMAWLAVAGAFGLVLWFGGSMPSQVVRTIHVGFLCLVAGAMIANHRSGSSSLRAVGWIVGVASFLVGLYHWALYEELIVRAGELTTLDLIVGIAGIAILIYLVWRVMGPALPIVAGLFLSYCLFGHWLPAPLDHRGYSLEQVVEHMAFGTEGIYGTPTLVSSTYIFLFILFGAFMEKAGVIDFFNDISMAVFGDKQGGPGKVCVASSALMGTVSGSGVANVVASGQFTIPADEALRLHLRLRRRRRGDLVHGRPDHAAGHGSGRLHHGRDHRRAVFEDRRSRDHSRNPLFRGLLSRGASGSGQAQPARPAEDANCRTPGPS